MRPRVLGALFGLLAVPLLAQEPAKPTVPAPPAPWPIVAPTGEWYDAQRLAALVAALRPLAEKHSGLRFVVDPVVKVADDTSWAKLVGEEMPKARDRALAVAITFALYSPARGEVVLGPYLAHGLLAGGETSRDRAAFARPLLVHELVHVLQEQHFHLPSRMRAAEKSDEKLVLRSMVEGFATWVEERAAAAEFGLADYGKRNTTMHRRNGRMEYLRGRDFCARLHERGGDEAVHAAMRAEALPLHEFVKIAVAKPAKADDAQADSPAKEKGGGK